MIARDQEEAFASVLVDMARCLEIAPRMLPDDFGPSNRYRLEELIGLGRDSHVYRAVDRHLSKPTVPAYVAIKIRASRASVRTEALVGRSVLHDNVVRIIDHGTAEDGASYVVQEWVDGGNLARLHPPLPAREAVGVVVPIARGLQALHSAGNIHGDLKPSNVLRTADGTPKITDFDLASAADLDEQYRGGNAAFMAPERVLDENTLPSPVADVYALGGLLYYFLTGRLPFGDNAEEIAANHRAGATADVSMLDPDLGRICLRALARIEAERYRSAEAFADDLTLWLERRPIPWMRPTALRRARLLWRRRPLPVIAAGLAVVSLVMAAGWLRVLIWRDIEAQRRAIQLSAEEMERTNAEVRSKIELFVKSSMWGSALNGASIFEALVWLDWFASLPILDDGPTIAMDQRISSLKTLREDYVTREQQGCFSDGMAAYSLAYCYLSLWNVDAAAEQLRAVETSVVRLLPETDDVRRSLRALELVEAYERAVLEDLPQTPELRRQMKQTFASLSRIDGSHSVGRLVEWALGISAEDARAGRV